jgi:hypothetical protein
VTANRHRVLFIDAGAGASGDMILGALVDLGVPLAPIRRALGSLPMGGWSIGSRRVRRAGISACKIEVRLRGRGRERGWREIRRIVAGGDLKPEVRDRALGVFRRLIEAEAKVHGTSADRVHLHEAGATDAIVDIVGACVGLAHLNPAQIVVSPMTTGYGTVRCRHGVYPVPGPATALLVRHAPVRSGDVEAERLTPTGAAILTTIAGRWGWMPPLRPLAVGYGAGDRDLGEHPNLLRMVLGDGEPTVPAPAHAEHAEVLVVEFSVDDATPQLLAFATERLLAAGALEVYTAPVVMKKGRPGHHVTALARPAAAPDIFDVILRETGTLGLRYRNESRVELRRSMERVVTPFGPVNVKVGYLGPSQRKPWPEYEDCAEIARRRGVTLREVQLAALRAVRLHSPRSTGGRGTGKGRTR